MQEVPSTVVLDCGGYHMRAGFAGEDGPRLDIPALVGQHRNKGVALAAGMNEYDIGEEAMVKRGMLTVKRPVRNGLVHDWDSMEKLWSHVLFTELRVTPESHCFTLTQPVNSPKQQKEKALEIMMETFHVNSLFLGTSQVLSLYAYGRTTGLIVDSGRDQTMAVPVHEGYALGRHVTKSDVAGDVLTSYLGGLLRDEGYSLGTDAEIDVLNKAKEDFCYVHRPSVFADTGSFRNQTIPGAQNSSRNWGQENDSVYQSLSEHYFFLPDGQRIPLRDHHRHLTPEVLFNFCLLDDPKVAASTFSSVAGQSSASLVATHEPQCKVRTEMGEIYDPSIPKGISWLAFAAIENCETSLHPQLYKNIVLAGGTVSFQGARERLESELFQMYRETYTSEAVTPIHVSDISCRAYSSWLGGAMISRAAMFPHLTVSRKEYEEEGLRVVHCKCL